MMSGNGKMLVMNVANVLCDESGKCVEGNRKVLGGEEGEKSGRRQLFVEVK